MTSPDALRILELPANATPAQVEARFRELRAVLEDKITHALTPGLQAKYRASLAEITTAFETLILAADTASMPGLSHLSSVPAPAAPRVPSLPVLPPIPSMPPASGISSPRLPPMPPAGSYGSGVALPPMPASAPVQPAAIAPAKKSGGKGLLIGVIAAVIVLGAGGWLVMKNKADNAEKARIEAEVRQQAEVARQKAEAGEKARITAAKAEQDKQLAALRARAAEINASFDSAQRIQLSTERELTELKAQREELSASGRNAPELRALAARIQSRERYLAWLNDNLPGHPARAARAPVTEALAARSIETATAALETYAKAVRQLLADLARSRDELFVITGRLRVNSEPIGVNFTLMDVYGRTSEGRTPADLPEVPLGSTTLTFKRDGWPEKMQTVAVTRGETATASANLAGSALSITSTPAGLNFVLTGPGRTERGRTPVTVADVPPGDYTATFTRDGWPELKNTVTVRAGQPAELPGTFPAAGTLTITSTPGGAEVIVRNQSLGTTPLQLPEYAPGKIEVEFKLPGYVAATTAGVLPAKGQLTLNATLKAEQTEEEKIIQAFWDKAKGIWRDQGMAGGSILGVNLRIRVIPGEMFVTQLMQLSSGVKFTFAGVDTATQSIKLTYKGRFFGTIKLQDGVLQMQMTNGAISRFGKISD